MKTDNELKRILQTAIQSAPDNFTARVMRQVETAAVKTAYQPLVSASLKKIFVRTFLIITFCIFIICWLLQNPNVSVIRVPSALLSGLAAKICFVIAAFWLLYFGNHVVSKKDVKPVRPA